MHPVIRIVTFLLLAVLMARAHPLQLGWVAVILTVLFAVQKGRGLQATGGLLWRLRWLLLSILLLYMWWPVGDVLHDSLLVGAQRMLVLAMIVLALQGLVLNLERDAIVTALYRVCYPLTWLKIPREQLVLRLVLTMDYARKLPELLKGGHQGQDDKRSRFKRLLNRVLFALQQVLERAETETSEPVTINTSEAVPGWQWVLPLFILAVFLGLGRLANAG